MHINRGLLLKLCKQTLSKMRGRKVDSSSDITWEEKIDYTFILWLTEVVVMLDPLDNCIMKGSQKKRKKLPKSKSLRFSPSNCGLPIGNLTSQLFSNIYLNIFDQFMKRILKCKHYGRYVDDSFVVSCDKAFLASIIPKAEKFLKEELGLELHKGKTKILDIEYGVEFLGVFFKPWRKYIASHTVRKINRRMQYTSHMGKERVRACVNSYIGIMKHYQTFNQRTEIMLRHTHVFKHGRFTISMDKFIPNSKLHTSVLIERNSIYTS